MSYNITHQTQIEAAKAYSRNKKCLALFDPFLDACQWMLRQLAGKELVSMDGYKLEVRHGHVVYNIFQNSGIVYGPEDQSDEELKRLYKEKEEARFTLMHKEKELTEYIQSKWK